MDRKRRAAEWGALAAALLGVVVVIVSRVSVGRTGAESTGHAAERLGATLRSALDSARVRAEAMAALPMIRAAVVTDAATLRDMVKDGVVLRPAADEALELYQIDGRRSLSLMRLPENARPVKLAAAPTLAIADDAGAIAVTFSVQVDPMYRDSGKHGAIAISRRIPLGDLRAALAGVNAELTGLEEPLLLSGSGPPAGSVSELPLAIPGVDRKLVLRVAAPSGSSGGQLAGGTLTALALLGFVALRLRRRPPEPVIMMEALPGPSDSITVVARPANEETIEPLLPLSPEPSSGEASVAVDDLIARRYRVLGPIGQGAATDVWLAQVCEPRGKMPKVVAIKLYRPPPPFPLDELEERARRVGQVAHPHLVAPFDVGQSGERLFLAMEYVEGCSVACLLRALAPVREMMPLKQSIAIVRAAAQGLHAAHRALIVHGALRPSNVLVGRHGHIKVDGLGTARPYLSAFTAPEQALAGPIDPRVDVYALGILLEELTRAPEGSSLVRPTQLDEIVARATNRSPRRRPSSCAALDADLAELELRVDDPPRGAVLGDFVERVRRSHA